MPVTILVVEDHDDVRKALRYWLELEFPRCRVVGAASGEQAIALACIESPSLVIMDMCLPGIDGIETARQVKAALPLAQIVMLTFYEDDIYRAKAQVAGVSAYVTKQRMCSELVPTLSALLARCAMCVPMEKA